MKSKIIILIFLIFYLSTSLIISQEFYMEEFYPKVENGKVINAYQNSLNATLTSILHQVWIPNNWEDEGRILYSYNASGLIEETSYETFTDGNWTVDGSILMGYNSSDQLIEFITLSYESNGTVAHGVKWEYSYSGNKQSEGIQYMWDTDSKLWESYKKEVYTYTGDLVTKTEDFNDMGDGSWDLAGETTFTYDGQNREIEILTRTWSEIDNKFTNSELTTTEYYKDYKMSKWHSRSWDLMNEKWSEENFTLTEYQYDASDNCIEEITTASYGIAGFSFETKKKLTHSYDGNNFLIETIDYTWDDVGSQFLPIMKSEATNNNEGQPLVVIDYVYSGGEWVQAEKYIYNYDGAVDVVNDIELPVQYELMQNYPNPFNPITTISYAIQNIGTVELKVYDLLGNDIATLVNETQSAGLYEVTLDASNLASGTYFYILKSGNNILSKKCVLLK